MSPETTQAYLRARGMQIVSGNLRDERIFLPYIIMDLAYQLFCKSVMPIPAKFELKKMKNELKKTYNRFNKDFFRIFTQEQQNEIIDAMDGFEVHVNNQLQITRVALSQAMRFLEFDLQMQMTDIFLINVLAQCAGIIYHDALTGKIPESVKHNKQIEDFAYQIVRFGNKYYKEQGGTRSVDINDVPALDASIDKLISVMVDWARIKLKNPLQSNVTTK